MSDPHQQLAQSVVDAVARINAGSGTSVADAMFSIPADEIGVFWHTSFDDSVPRTAVTVALGASPGAAAGRVVLSADEAIDAAAAGEQVILVRPETTPEDVLGMQSSAGILTMRGGITSHAAVVARGWGIPAVVGSADLVINGDGIDINGTTIARGEWISIDGRTGEVFAQRVPTVGAKAPFELAQLLQWADRIRLGAERPVVVRANADNSEDAAHARRLGAEGIGLCRTEHMFLAEDRLPLVRRFILTEDPTVEAEALAALEAAQQADFEGILEAMSGLPVTVRLLDPPLHEFLPDLERLLVAEAKGELDADGLYELAAVRRLHEVNPMIGTRGVRLGVVRPGLYQMQVRALSRAMAAVRERSFVPRVEIMIPLVIDSAEMRSAHAWIAEALAAVGMRREDVSIGTMVETPRAALVAGSLAEVADFFSFGTNDLTQLTYAFSRDDVGSRLIPAYTRDGLLPADPFERLDRDGVGRLIHMACTDGRATKENLKIGVCGEHAGDPHSVEFLVHCGVDYVSCSPYRVPIARLAAAQAVLRAGTVPAAVLNEITASAEPEPANDAHEGDSFMNHDAGDVEFLVLHALRLKGFASPEVVAEVAYMNPEVTVGVLSVLAERGHAKFFEARNLWQLTPDGKAAHAALLPHYPAAVLDALREPYEQFLELNNSFKECCSNWQTRNGAVNDHTDAAYDAERIAALRELHMSSAGVLDSFVATLPRMATYPRRLAIALGRVESGETKMFTGVMCSSYHDVWMELHEDLVQLLGVDRTAEGSF